MNLILKRFSQEVDLENPEEVRYLLVFDHGGQEIRLPVQKETTEALAQALYGNGSLRDTPHPVQHEMQNQMADEMSEEMDAATRFGEDDEELAPPFTTDIYEGPESEEEIPSV